MMVPVACPPAAVHHQPSPGARLAFVFICPGRFEAGRGYPCAAGTGANLARALQQLHRLAPAVFTSPERVHTPTLTTAAPGQTMTNLDQLFTEPRAEWRHAGCSMCLGMNPDQLAPGERSASTSNRNFEGRQGKGGRTHLVSPQVAAATAVTGRLTSPTDVTDASASANVNA